MERTKLQDLILDWSESVDRGSIDSDSPPLVTYACDSKYTNSDFRFDKLEGDDRLRADALKDICVRNGISIYPADLERVRTGCSESYPSHYGEPDHDIDEVDERDLNVEEVVTVNGNVAELLAIDEANFIQSDPFDDDNPDEKEYDADDAVVTETHRVTVSAKLMRYTAPS